MTALAERRPILSDFLRAPTTGPIPIGIVGTGVVDAQIPQGVDQVVAANTIAIMEATHALGLDIPGTSKVQVDRVLITGHDDSGLRESIDVELMKGEQSTKIRLMMGDHHIPEGFTLDTNDPGSVRELLRNGEEWGFFDVEIGGNALSNGYRDIDALAQLLGVDVDLHAYGFFDGESDVMLEEDPRGRFSLVVSVIGPHGNVIKLQINTPPYDLSDVINPLIEKDLDHTRTPRVVMSDQLPTDSIGLRPSFGVFAPTTTRVKADVRRFVGDATMNEQELGLNTSEVEDAFGVSISLAGIIGEDSKLAARRIEEVSRGIGRLLHHEDVNNSSHLQFLITDSEHGMILVDRHAATGETSVTYSSVLDESFIPEIKKHLRLDSDHPEHHVGAGDAARSIVLLTDLLEKRGLVKRDTEALCIALASLMSGIVVRRKEPNLKNTDIEALGVIVQSLLPVFLNLNWAVDETEIGQVLDVDLPTGRIVHWNMPEASQGDNVGGVKQLRPRRSSQFES